MAKINAIDINGFKAFPSKFELELKGKHLLMYGENGSGKSSIYYALHCIFNSFRKPDKGKKYFDRNNPQNLINRNFKSQDTEDIPYVAVNWQDGARGPFLSAITDEGCQNFDRLAELDTYFINHQLLFDFFNFTNSKSINLFPVFQREFLPYEYIDEHGTYLSLMYEQIIEEASKLGNKSSSKKINEMIDLYNYEIDIFIGDINLNVSDIYNNCFRTEGDPLLKITLLYPEVNPNPDTIFNGYRLKWDYPLIKSSRDLIKAPNKALIEPIIGISINDMEGGKPIDKPHVDLNEAKLTAIALSIRLALLNLENPAEGSFFALDDMLISLDMSNRAKIVDFLLGISDKYKIYLFTHDRTFFEYFKEKIKYLNLAKGLPQTEGWLYKEIYQENIPLKNPKMIDSETAIAMALKHYRNFDYPASANYMRKAVEQMVDEIFPPKLSRNNKGEKYDTLRGILDNSYKFFLRIPEFDISILSNLIGKLNLLLNPLSHKSIDTNVYKNDLKEVFVLLEKLTEQVSSLEIKELFPREEKVYLFFVENEHTTQKYEIELKEEWYSYIVNGDKHILQSEAKSLQSWTINNEVQGEATLNGRYKGTLETICQKVHERKQVAYMGNYLEFYKDKDGNTLMQYIVNS